MTARSSTGALVVAGSGHTRDAYGRWHTPESVVCWASGTKVFLAAAARSLVARGDLTWEATVGELLDVPAPPTMTLASLVEHRSGLPRTLPEQRATLPDPYAGWTTERFDERVLGDLTNLAAQGAPGEVAYSNVGYAVLSRVLERIGGASWLELVREHVLAPLGVPGDAVVLAPPEASPTRTPRGTGTAWAAPDVPAALGARDLRGRPVAEWDVSVGPFAASGGLCSTIPGMVGILRAALGAGSPLLPGEGPHAWERQGSRAWHAGALFRSGSLVVVDTGTGAVGAAHAVGGLPGHGARYAERALTALLPDARTGAGA
jgi:CubicO group peptidase (beta-lactamase class C family)